MRHVKLPLRHQSKRLVRVQTEENESRADRDVGHYFIIVRRGSRWRGVEERLRVVVVGRAKNRDVSSRRIDARRLRDWRASETTTSPQRCRRQRGYCRQEEPAQVLCHS